MGAVRGLRAPVRASQLFGQGARKAAPRVRRPAGFGRCPRLSAAAAAVSAPAKAAAAAAAAAAAPVTAATADRWQRLCRRPVPARAAAAAVDGKQRRPAG